MSSLPRIQQGIASEHPEWIPPKRCQQEARQNGVYAAVTMAAATAVLGQHVFLWNRNSVVLGTCLVTVLAGYATSRLTFERCSRGELFLAQVRAVRDLESVGREGSDGEVIHPMTQREHELDRQSVFGEQEVRAK